MDYVNRTFFFQDYAYRQFMSRDKDEFKNDLCNRIVANMLNALNRFAWSFITHVDRNDDFTGHEDFSLGRYNNVDGITNDTMFIPTFFDICQQASHRIDQSKPIPKKPIRTTLPIWTPWIGTLPLASKTV